MASIPKLPREMSFQQVFFFFFQTHPGKKGHTVVDTCRQRKTIKTLATDINTLLQLQNKQQKYVCCKCICKSSQKIN